MDVKKIKPITPKEVEEAKKNDIPSFVIEAVNKLLKYKWDGKKAIITQDEIISTMKPSNVSFRGVKVLSKHWLDFEKIYEENGWKVESDKHDKFYKTHFKFTKNE